MSRNNRPAKPTLPSTVSQAHIQNCSLHDNEDVPSKCTAITLKGVKCQFKSRRFPPDSLPVCAQHQNKVIAAGRCQAVMSCGQACGRLNQADPPFNLCHEHCQCTSTLPCYILELPIELRFQIYRLLLPEVVPSRVKNGEDKTSLRSYRMLLKLNKQICNEVETVLYRHIPFKIEIDRYRVLFCNRRYKLHNVNVISDNLHSVASMLPVFQKIHNIRMDITINLSVDWDLNTMTANSSTQYILPENEGLLALRDSLRLFIRTFRTQDTISENHGLITLEVGIKDDDEVAWNAAETVAAVALATEPLKHFRQVQHPILHNITIGSNTELRMATRGLNTAEFATTYDKYKAEWQGLMVQASPQLALEPYANQGLHIDTTWTQIQSRKIHEFITVLENNMHFLRPPHARGVGFEGMARILYLARLAHEQNDIHALHLIRDALKNRWIDVQRIQQRHASTVAKSILDMFHDDYQVALLKAHPRELKFTKARPLAPRADASWSELKLADFHHIPSQWDGVKIIAEDRLRLYWEMRGVGESRGQEKVYVVLKTPSFVSNLHILQFFS